MLITIQIFRFTGLLDNVHTQFENMFQDRSGLYYLYQLRALQRQVVSGELGVQHLAGVLHVTH